MNSGDKATLWAFIGLFVTIGSIAIAAILFDHMETRHALTEGYVQQVVGDETKRVIWVKEPVCEAVPEKETTQ